MEHFKIAFWTLKADTGYIYEIFIRELSLNSQLLAVICDEQRLQLLVSYHYQIFLLVYAITILSRSIRDGFIAFIAAFIPWGVISNFSFHILCTSTSSSKWFRLSCNRSDYALREWSHTDICPSASDLWSNTSGETFVMGVCSATPSDSYLISSGDPNCKPSSSFFFR